MHRTRFIFGISVLFLVAGIVVTAQQGHAGGQKPAPPKPTAAKPPATQKVSPTPHATPAPQAAAAQSKVKPQPKPAATASNTKAPTKPGKPDTAAMKTPAKSPAATTAKTEKSAAPAKTEKAASPAKTAKADGKTAKSDKPADTKVAKTEKKSEKPVKATATSTGTTTAVLTPVQQKLRDNKNLATKVESRLPKGTDLMAASAGFKNLGQFIAAVNVSNNLGISFDELKAKMVTNNMSLGQAIQAVRPLTASPTIEAQRAEYDARGMISESEHEQTETATAAKPKSGPVTTGTSSPTTTTTTTTSTATTKAKPKPKASAQ